MPVIDHSTHPSTQRGPGHRYSCWNRPRPGSLVNLDKLGMIPNRMSTECRYDLSLSDPCCTDCKHRGSGEEYDKSVRSTSPITGVSE